MDKKGLNVEFLLSYLFVVVFWFVVLFVFCQVAHAEVRIDLRKIAMIESSGNPLAINAKDDSIGLYQITPICLKEWNQFHKNEKYSREDLFNPIINERIAQWMLEVRIPAMIRHYGKIDSVENRIIAFNAGIAYVVNGKELPRITKNYIEKYRRMK